MKQLFLAIGILVSGVLLAKASLLSEGGKPQTSCTTDVSAAPGSTLYAGSSIMMCIRQLLPAPPPSSTTNEEQEKPEVNTLLRAGTSLFHNILK